MLRFPILLFVSLYIACRVNGLSVATDVNTDSGLDAIYGDPFDDCIEVTKCANCKGTGMMHNFRTMDGTCNHLENTVQGAVTTQHKRFLDPEYLTGTTGYPRGFTPRSTALPSAHKVAREVFQSVDANTGNSHQPHKTSILFLVYGQFIDHDITATGHGKTNDCSADCDKDTNVHNYPCDPIRKHDDADTLKCTKLTRTSAACRDSGDTTSQREQVNKLTSYIDGSAIYGTSDEQAASLRDMTDTGCGKLRMGANDLLPDDNDLDEMCNDAGRAGCFAAGDARSAEHIGLASMHTLWAREHNRIATELKWLNPVWSSSRIYYEARRIVVAEMQHVLLNEWLPIVVEKEADSYWTYKNDYDASINNAFSHAAYRFGHTLIPDKLPQLDESFNQIADREFIPLRDAFFNTKPLRDHGIENTMYGMLSNESDAVDTRFSAAIARHLFMPLGKGGLEDLSAINIHRGRDHGLAPYLEWRKFCGASDITTWAELREAQIMKDETVDNLEGVYENVEDIDLFVGGISETPVLSKIVGPTFGCIIKKQFEATLMGDRYFYKNHVFSSDKLIEIENVRMRQILCDNLSGAVSVQEWPFRAFTDPTATRPVCDDYATYGYQGVDLSLWYEPTTLF